MLRHRAISICIVCLGISSIITQIISLREFLQVFSGNELILGIILGNWLLLTGLGSYLGRFSGRLRQPVPWLVAAQFLIALLPFIHISAIRYLKQLFVSGLILGLHEAFFYSLLLLLPYCLVSGFMLSLCSGLGGQDRNALQIGEVYVLDTIGGILGGMVFSLVLVFYFQTFQVLTFLMVLNLTAAVLVTAAERSRYTAVTILFAAAVVAVLACNDLEQVTIKAMYGGQNLIYQESTPYGAIAVTREGEQITVFENGIPAGSTGNISAAEESIHYGLSQHPDPENILIISGGIDGVLGEAAKYGSLHIDYVELDPAMIELVRKLVPSDKNNSINLIAQDGRRLVKSRQNEYDAILMTLADPASAQLNRFYTVEFFKDAARALRKGGILSFSLSGAENYAGQEIRFLSSSIYHSLKTVFPNILIIPGGRQFFIASDRTLSLDIASLLDQKGIQTEYVNNDYLAARLTEDRLAAAERLVAGPAPLNLDFRPASYYASLRYWLSQFESTLLLPFTFMVLAGLAACFLVMNAPNKPVAAALFTSGFAGMGLEVIILLSVQILYGFVYQQIGVIITAFLVGSALGAVWTAKQQTSMRVLAQLDLLLALLSCLLIPALSLLAGDSHGLLPAPVLLVTFPLFTACIGFMVGGQFPPGALLLFNNAEKTAGTLYSLDFLGACLGALTISAFLVPLLGLTKTCMLIGSVKLASTILLSQRHQPAFLDQGTIWRSNQNALAGWLIMLLVFTATGTGIIHDSTRTVLYAFSFSAIYHWTVLALLTLGIMQALGIEMITFQDLARLIEKMRPLRIAGLSLLRWIYFLCFSLLIFYPLFRCYFKVPYLFCHVCPRQCVFGYLRPYLVPAALLMNLEKRKWCFNCCPIGTMYDCQARVGLRTPPLPAFFSIVALAVLAFTALSYFKIRTGHTLSVDNAGSWYMLFSTSVFAPSAVVLTISAALILLGFIFRRTFCDLLCPVGTFSGLALRLERLFDRKGITTDKPSHNRGGADV